jgi:hypothetical protein
MRVHLSERQLEWLESRLEGRVRAEKISLLFIFGAFFLLLADPALKEWAAGFFALGALRMIYR